MLLCIANKLYKEKTANRLCEKFKDMKRRVASIPVFVISCFLQLVSSLDAGNDTSVFLLLFS